MLKIEAKNKPKCSLLNLTFSISRNGLREAMFIEMQGTFEIDGDLSGDLFGEIIWRGKDRTPLLFIQHQMYVGEIKTIKKPFLVMDRRTVRDDAERPGEKKVRNNYMHSKSELVRTVNCGLVNCPGWQRKQRESCDLLDRILEPV